MSNIYIATLFEFHNKRTYCLGTYLSEDEAYDRIFRYTEPYKLSKTTSPDQVSYVCADLDSMIWVKKLIIGDAPFKTVDMFSTHGQSVFGNGVSDQCEAVAAEQTKLFDILIEGFRNSNTLKDSPKKVVQLGPGLVKSYFEIIFPNLEGFDRLSLTMILNIKKNRKNWITLLDLVMNEMNDLQGATDTPDTPWSGSGLPLKDRAAIPDIYHKNIDKFILCLSDKKFVNVLCRFNDFSDKFHIFKKLWQLNN
tara:strand:- start:320 stop:1072 length:753 start_codon:yes stop_codon:yes gene_type:complete